MTAPSSMVTPRPITTLGSMRTSRPILASNDRNDRLGGDERRALGHRAAAQAILQRRLGGGELRPVVDPHHLLLLGGQGAGNEAARVGDFDDIGQVIFLLRVIGRHRFEEAQRFGPAEGDRPGVAQAPKPSPRRSHPCARGSRPGVRRAR